MSEPGLIVVLNGAPRAGKSSIAHAMQDSCNGIWMHIGVDAFARHITPPRLRPGIGLRPGGERPDLEAHIQVLYDALYDSVLAQSRLGLNVVVDVGHHDGYSRPLGILPAVARRLRDVPAYLVGIRCPVAVIMARRDARPVDGPTRYATSGGRGEVPEEVVRWECAVHDPGIYDLEVDTSVLSATQCAAAVAERLDRGSPSAFGQLADT